MPQRKKKFEWKNYSPEGHWEYIEQQIFERFSFLVTALLCNIYIAPQLMVFSPYFGKIIYFLVILSSDDYCIISIYLFRVKKHELV